ncbi:glycosyltransferase family 2 protein [Virgibacillus flavescens]|uniref:glycosyltransferase family 2 protein n=1 Tax=Virgibacillus flavescens TaxID=1611422 RepID=UPI003D330B93
MSIELVTKAQKLLNDKNTKIVNAPSSIKNKLFAKKKKVTVITAAYNCKEFIQRCMDSVVEQSLGKEQIEFIIVDDCSTDGTQELLKANAKEHACISLVLLPENSGTAAMPRNLGIELATTEKVMFLDSDDWLAKEALEILSETMDKNNDDFVVGKTIKVEDKGESILAEFVSYKERLHQSPTQIPYLFYHMGPPSKLMKTSIIKENTIRFPEMKFGEDKQFLIDVLLYSTYVSTLTEPICYVNRLSNNNQSLTRSTEVIEKRRADLEVFKSLLNRDLPLEFEKIVMKRLVEYDLIKSCDSMVFLNSKEKDEFIAIIKEALALLATRPYNIIESFDSPRYQAAARMVENNDFKKFISLFNWMKFEKNKHVLIDNNNAYDDVNVFEEDDPDRYIPIPLFIRAVNSFVDNDEYVQVVEVYGEKLSTIKNVVIRDRDNTDNEIEVPIVIENNSGEFRVKYKELDKLNNAFFTVFIRYDGYRLANIKRILNNQITYSDRKFMFYTTKAGNIGFSLKDN